MCDRPCRIFIRDGRYIRVDEQEMFLKRAQVVLDGEKEGTPTDMGLLPNIVVVQSAKVQWMERGILVIFILVCHY